MTTQKFGVDKISKFWAKPLALEEKKQVVWMEHPRVNRQINKRITGNVSVDWFSYVIQKYFPNPINHALSIGCGEGGLERHALTNGFANFFDAIDVSQGVIEKAKNLAKSANVLHRVKYIAADVNELVLSPNSYNAVFASSSIHHIQALEKVFEQISKALRDGGYFICNEYVGPTYFQLPQEQLNIINELLKIIPKDFRRIIRDGKATSEIKTSHENPPLSWFEEYDPSEAVRSADILSVLEEFFQIIELKSYGGTLLQFLLQNIVGNFQDGQEEHDAWLDLLMYLEILLEERGVINNDFVVVVAVPKS